MTLRDRCEALVREWRCQAHVLIEREHDAFTRCADALQAALDATADEGRDVQLLADIQEYLAVGCAPLKGYNSQCMRLAMRIDQAMKESKP